MKTLNRTILRSIKSNLSYYISIILLTALAVFLVSVAFSNAYMISDDIKSIMASGNVESSQFLTSVPLSKENIEKLEKEHGVLIEETEYLDFLIEDKTYRFFKPTQKINKYQILQGDRIQNKNEILLDRDFANSNDIEIADIYTIDGKDYTVVGFAVRPDYVYSPKNLTDAWVDKADFAMVQIDPDMFEELKNEGSYSISAYYSVSYGDDTDTDAFRRCIYDEYGAYSYLSAKSNVRISKPLNAGLEMLMLAWFIGPLLFAIILMLISVVLGRMIEREKKHIGTLLSFGYRNYEIGMHYSVYAIIPAIIGSVTGVLLASLAGKGVAMYLLYDYQLINYDYYIRTPVVLICLIVPIVLYGSVAYLRTHKLFKRNSIVSLLTDRKDNTRKQRHMLEESKISFKSKFRTRELLSKPSRTLLVLLCLFLSSFMSLFGFALGDTVDKMTENGIESGTVYKYNYYLNQMLTDNSFGGVNGISVSYEMSDNGNSIVLNGVPTDSKFKNMELLDGVYSRSGFYISNAVAIERGLHKGDKIKIRNTVTLEDIEIRIDGIVNDNTNQAVYTSYENVKDIMQLKEDYFNIIYSDEELSIPNDKLAYISDSQSIIDILDTAMSALDGFVYGLVVIGSMLGVISVYLVVNMIIEENKANISMLKVLGYRNREIRSIVMNTNHILVILGLLISYPLCYGTLGVLSRVAIPYMHVVLRPCIDISSLALTALLIAASYFFSLLLLFRKVDKIDMVLALKGNRE